jgi:hypothetical protein
MLPSRDALVPAKRRYEHLPSSACNPTVNSAKCIICPTLMPYGVLDGLTTETAVMQVTDGTVQLLVSGIKTGSLEHPL